MTSGGYVGTDNHGHLIYQGRKPFGIRTPCRPVGDASPLRSPTPSLTDSLVIIRADFETRVVDTIGRAQTSSLALHSLQPAPTRIATLLAQRLR